MARNNLSVPLPILDSALPLLEKIMVPMKRFNTRLASTTIRFLLKFYSKKEPKITDYFTSFIAATHLSSKVTECSIPIARIGKELLNSKEEPQFKDCMEKIGAPSMDDENFVSDLVKNAFAREMDIISTLNFDFTLPNPQELCAIYLDRLLSWHYDLNLPEILYFRERDCYRTTARMLNEILMCSEFYAINIELSSLVITQLTLEHYMIEFPKKGKRWFRFLNPSVKEEDFDEVYATFKKYIDARWAKLQMSKEPSIPFDLEQFHDFIFYPVEPSESNHEPMCKPPPFSMIEDFLPRDKLTIYHNSYADHAPLCPPVPMKQYGDPLPPPQILFSLQPLKPERKLEDKSTKHGSPRSSQRRYPSPPQNGNDYGDRRQRDEYSRRDESHRDSRRSHHGESRYPQNDEPRGERQRMSRDESRDDKYLIQRDDYYNDRPPRDDLYDDRRPPSREPARLDRRPHDEWRPPLPGDPLYDRRSGRRDELVDDRRLPPRREDSREDRRALLREEPHDDRRQTIREGVQFDRRPPSRDAYIEERRPLPPPPPLREDRRSVPRDEYHDDRRSSNDWRREEQLREERRYTSKDDHPRRSVPRESSPRDERRYH